MRAIVISCLALIGLGLGAVAAQEPDKTAEEPKLGLELRNVRVRAALDEISKVTGEKHTSKGFVGDLSVSIFVHDPDPEKIRAALKDLLDLYWSEETKDEKTEYVLWQDARGRARQADLVKKLAAEQEPYRCYEELLNARNRISSLDAAGLEALKADDPVTYLMATDPTRRAYGDLLAYLGPDIFAWADPDQDYEFTYEELPPACQDLVQQCIRSARDFNHPLMSISNDSGENHEITPEPNDTDIDWSGTKLQISKRGVSVEETITKDWDDGNLGAIMAGYTMSLSECDPHNPEAQAHARLQILMMGMKPEDIPGESSGSLEDQIAAIEQAIETEMEKEGLVPDQSSEVEREIPEELQRVVEIKPDGKLSNNNTEEEVRNHYNAAMWGEEEHRQDEKVAEAKAALEEIVQLRARPLEAFLSVLAKAADIDIYVDAYPAKAPDINNVHSVYPPESDPRNVAEFFGSRPLFETLDMLAKKYQCEWDYKDGAILVRDNKWFEKRAWIIPEAWFARWQNTLGEKEKFTFDEIARAATELTDDQTRHGIDADRKLYAAGLDCLFSHAWEYRLYGILSADQIHQAEKDGLPLANLRTEQAQAYINALRRKGRWAETPADIRLKISREDETVKLRITSPGNWGSSDSWGNAVEMELQAPTQ